jgi:hypothetical protein
MDDCHFSHIKKLEGKKKKKLLGSVFLGQVFITLWPKNIQYYSYKEKKGAKWSRKNILKLSYLDNRFFHQVAKI